MKRMGHLILLLAALAALKGCGFGDPGQPAPGSISVGSKSEDGPGFAPKKGGGTAPAR